MQEGFMKLILDGKGLQNIQGFVGEQRNLESLCRNVTKTSQVSQVTKEDGKQV